MSRVELIRVGIRVAGKQGSRSYFPQLFFEYKSLVKLGFLVCDFGIFVATIVIR